MPKGRRALGWSGERFEKPARVCLLRCVATLNHLAQPALHLDDVHHKSLTSQGRMRDR